MKHCKKCDVLLELSSFKDKSLVSGYGVVCNACKGATASPKKTKKTKSKTSKKRSYTQNYSRGLNDTKIGEFKIRNNYLIEYTNLQNQKSTREVLIESVDQNRGTFRAYCFLKGTSLTFRADRAKIIKEI